MGGEVLVRAPLFFFIFFQITGKVYSYRYYSIANLGKTPIFSREGTVCCICGYILRNLITKIVQIKAFRLDFIWYFCKFLLMASLGCPNQSLHNAKFMP